MKVFYIHKITLKLIQMPDWYIIEGVHKYNKHFQHEFDVLNLQTCQVNIGYAKVSPYITIGP